MASSSVGHMAGSSLSLPTTAALGTYSVVIFVGVLLLSVAFWVSAALYSVMRCGIKSLRNKKRKGRTTGSRNEAQKVLPGHV